MASKKHLDVGRFYNEEAFKSKRTGRNPEVPGNDRNTHGSLLRNQYESVLTQYSEIESQRTATITNEIGIYVEVISNPGCELPIDSLNNKDFKLCSLKSKNNQEIATVFISLCHYTCPLWHREPIAYANNDYLA